MAVAGILIALVGSVLGSRFPKFLNDQWGYHINQGARFLRVNAPVKNFTADSAGNCQPGHVVNTLDACKDASEELKIPFHGSLDPNFPRMYRNFPVGCFVMPTTEGRYGTEERMSWFNPELRPGVANSPHQAHLGAAGICSTAAAYYKAGVTTNCSPGHVVTTVDACKDASEELDIPFQVSLPSTLANNWPVGCFVQANGRMSWFNPVLLAGTTLVRGSSGICSTAAEYTCATFDCGEDKSYIDMGLQPDCGSNNCTKCTCCAGCGGQYWGR